MWAVVSTSKNLKFYDFEKSEFTLIVGVEYIENKFGLTDYLEDHDQNISKILSAGILIFINKVLSVVNNYQYTQT